MSSTNYELLGKGSSATRPTSTSRRGPPGDDPEIPRSRRTRSGWHVLELTEKGNLHKYLWDIFDGSAEALPFTYSCGVVYSDIHCVNFLLDGRFDLKVADFAEASIEASKSWPFYRATHRLPDAEDKDSRRMEITAASEIFGFGSALHDMVIGHDIVPELDSARDRAEIVRPLWERKFPDTSEPPVLGSVISKCWNVECDSTVDIVDSIDAKSRSFANHIIA